MNISASASRHVRSFALTLMTAVLGYGLLPAPVQAAPQLPDFTYQGRLTQSGAPANGEFDFTFELFDEETGGQQVGQTVTELDFPVSDGLFTVALAFPGAFTGTQMWLQVSIDGVGLLPRQAVSTTPVAQFALSGTIGGPAGGDLSGTYPNPVIADNAITSAHLATDSVGAIEIQDDSIDSGEIVDGSIFASDIGADAVGSSEIASNAIGSSEIAADAVGASEITANAVGSSELASGAVTTTKLANDSVTLAKTVGGATTGTISVNIGGNDCADLGITVGGAQVGDLPVFAWGSNASVSSNLTLVAMRATANTVIVRACNHGAGTATVTNQPVNIRTFR